jgi:lipopolysaccharide/colanic/teichoic acid biosynthesis glycosyltransferase
MSGSGQRQQCPPPTVDAPERSRFHRAAVRSLDVVVATIVLVLTLPISVIAAIAVKVSSPGPVFTKQVCHGARERRFEMLGFRTTTVEVSHADPALSDSEHSPDAMSGEHRTRVGRILAATSIDELPRFWNVLRGDMSIVGPRPMGPHGSARTTGDRTDVPPGMTGMWRATGR